MKSTSWSLKDVAEDCASYLREKGVDGAKLSSDLLVGHVLGFTRLEMILHPDYELGQSEISKIHELVRRRGRGEPVAYILGKKEFYALELEVDARVLVPRPETELIVDLVKDLFDRDSDFLFADIGTGSGAIAAALLHLFPKSKCLLADISMPALKLAAGNVRKYFQEVHSLIVQSDLASCLKGSRYDLVVSNPPYLTEADFYELDKEVSGFEPREALVAGRYRSEMHRKIAEQAHPALKPDGWLIMEMDCRQKHLQETIFENQANKWVDSFVCKDLSGLD